mmetsp:Transcript_2350/g.4042  ORF Transcript_2350/g.4042 Transcript_2350/m.4042 type:complete len:81 (-) Transcript_2350:254-496(-)
MRLDTRIATELAGCYDGCTAVVLLANATTVYCVNLGDSMVSRAFGDIALKKFGVLCSPDYMKFKVDSEKDQYIILACDGV